MVKPRTKLNPYKEKRSNLGSSSSTPSGLTSHKSPNDTPSFPFIHSMDFHFRNKLLHQQLMKVIAGKKSLNERFDKADKSLRSHKCSKCD